MKAYAAKLTSSRAQRKAELLQEEEAKKQSLITAKAEREKVSRVEMCNFDIRGNSMHGQNVEFGNFPETAFGEKFLQFIGEIYNRWIFLPFFTNISENV